MEVCFIAETLGIWGGSHCLACHEDYEDDPERMWLCESESPAGITYLHCCAFDSGLLTTEEWAQIEARDNP